MFPPLKVYQFPLRHMQTMRISRVGWAPWTACADQFWNMQYNVKTITAKCASLYQADMSSFWSGHLLNRHITFIQRRFNIDATSWRWATFYKRHVPAGWVMHMFSDRCYHCIAQFIVRKFVVIWRRRMHNCPQTLVFEMGSFNNIQITSQRRGPDNNHSIDRIYLFFFVVFFTDFCCHLAFILCWFTITLKQKVFHGVIKMRSRVSAI